ncbi:MAG: SIS domain-containing protein [Psittacicella sp.]
MRKQFYEILNQLVEETTDIEQSNKEIIFIAKKCVDCLLNGNKIISHGYNKTNIVSQYFANNMINSFKIKRTSLPCINLTLNEGDLNLEGDSLVYSIKLSLIAKPEDLLIIFSLDMKEPYLEKLLASAKKRSIKSIIISSKQEKFSKDYDVSYLFLENISPYILVQNFISIVSILSSLIENSIFLNPNIV